ncbi:MAG: hypothetical protein AB7S26_03920 [Sandaracinaceae bacterium]
MTDQALAFGSSKLDALTALRAAPRKVETHADEALTVLAMLYGLAQHGVAAEPSVLAQRLGWGLGRVFRVLGHLDEKGLADRQRCRLTFGGLAIAASFAARSR